MELLSPSVILLSRPSVIKGAIQWHLMEADRLYAVPGETPAMDWLRQRYPTQLHLYGEDLIEIAGRMCYRSWAPQLNPNVSKIREDRKAYLENILKVGHGSVIEHANYSFIITGSRVFTHEHVRHRPGVAISQESMRFVRLTDIPFYIPDWAQEDKELMDRIKKQLHYDEHFQEWMANHFKLDDPGVPFHEKKAKTSFMRRLAPQGVMTVMTWTANVRTIRHIVEMRTDPGAEEEIRIIANEIGHIMKTECPTLFGDYTVTEDGDWQTEHRKV